MNTNKKNLKVFTLILVASALLLSASPIITSVKGQGTASISILSAVGGTTTPTGTQSYTIGTIQTLTANPGSGFKFIGWVTATAAGSTTFTDNPLSLNITSSGCAVQAFFAPTDSNISVVPEFSSAGAFILVAILVAVAFGTFAIRRQQKSQN